MTFTLTFVSYFEVRPQVAESVREQFVYTRTIHNFVHLRLPLNAECIQHRSVLIPSLMPIIKTRRLGLCTRNTAKKKKSLLSLRDLPNISVLNTAENSHGLFLNLPLSSLLSNKIYRRVVWYYPCYSGKSCLHQ